MNTFTIELDTIYAACSPELGVTSYGDCQDEALNNLTVELRQRGGVAESTGEKRDLHALN